MGDAAMSLFGCALIGLALTARQTAAQHVVLSDLAVDIAAATLSGAGEVDFDREQFTARATLRVPELAPLGELIATPPNSPPTLN